MKSLRQRTLKRLGQHATGDGGMTRYRSGAKLVELFNEFGCDDIYPAGGGFPSRWAFAEERLAQINATTDLAGLIERIFDPDEFPDDKNPSAAAEDFNVFLRRDGFEVSITPTGAKLRNIDGASVAFVAPPTFRPASQEFISEHIRKCESKLREGDFNGAITNARSLCEEVLCDLERQLEPHAHDYDGDLPRLYKRVRTKLNTEPEQHAGRQDVAQLLRGLTTVVDGLSGMSNLVGDRHGGTRVRPKPHHAHLAVNAANTLCTFLLSSFAMQRELERSGT